MGESEIKLPSTTRQGAGRGGTTAGVMGLVPLADSRMGDLLGEGDVVLTQSLKHKQGLKTICPDKMLGVFPAQVLKERSNQGKASIQMWPLLCLYFWPHTGRTTTWPSSFPSTNPLCS